jgi:hypothetical protein
MVEEVEDTLPDLPSALIRVAIGDLIKIEKSPLYHPNMEIWHSGGWASDHRNDGKCQVCWAGAVMVESLHAPINRNMWPEDYISSIGLKLHAIDDFRSGEWAFALDMMGIDTSEFDLSKLDDDPPCYRDDPEAFKECMLRAADILEGIGL